MITLSHTYTARFVFYHDAAPTTPDNAPTAVLLRNGVASGESAVVAAVSGQTGEYTITFTTLAGWAVTDHLEVRITVDHSGTVHRSIVFDSLAHPDAPMRGNDTAPATPTNITDAQAAILAKLPANLVNGRISANVGAVESTIRVVLAAAQPDYAPAQAGDEMALPAATLAELFSDADVTDLVNQIVAKFDGADDLPVQQIATETRDAILNRVLAANHETAGSVGKVLQFLDALVSSRSSHAAPDLSNLDAPISSRSSHSAPDLSNLDAPVSSRLSSADLPTNFASLLIDANGRILVGGFAPGQIPIREGVEYNHVASSDNETRAATITPV
ncbi:MAG: hypothetical protein NXI04_17465 [Planctomycetaceae bacterium]|nr:hypothetical protein [Planctomycetaceae bacterium]